MLQTKSTAKPRTSPYIWVTWVTKLISGEESCKYKLWFRANNRGYSKVPSTFNLAKWCEDHTALIEKRKLELISQGYKVFLEDQNSFALTGKSGATLSGKADIVAIKGSDALVIDCKTGQQRNSDVTQVKLYMLALPLANERHRGLFFRGEVQYKDKTVPIPSEAINDIDLINALNSVMGTTSLPPGDEVETLTCASFGECRFCDLTSADCKSRVESDSNKGTTDLF